MTRYLTITNTNKKGARKRTLPLRKPTAGPVTLTLITILILCLVSLFYLAQIFKSSTKGYDVSELEKKVTELKEQNTKLEIEAAELKSFKNIEESANQLNMVSISNIIYLTSSGSTVAIKK